jgi:LacI family transcriptional regulator, galactose operon repressor
MASDPDEQAPRRTAPRLRDVADAAGVDPSIASRILSGDGALTVRPDTRQRVLEAASRLAYRPNTSARALKTRKTMAIGMIVPELTNVAYATIAMGADERASRAGYALLVATGAVRDRLDAIDGRIDGLLVGIATSETIRMGDLGGSLPTVLVNRHELLGLPSVTVDDEAGSALATEHLLSLGHRHVGHVAGPQNSDTGRRRRAGFVRAMRGSGVEPPPGWMVEASYDEAGGDLAASRLLRAAPRPTALFVANVRAAIGALAAARRLGLSVPGDLSLVGFHDAPVAVYLDPSLTTVRMPLREMGSAAVDSLFALLEGRTVEDVRVASPPELVVRGSTAPPPRR